MIIRKGILAGIIAVVIISGVVAFITSNQSNALHSNTVRIGYFTNITHVPALVAKQQHLFENELGSSIDVQYKAFNAGPAAIEALFTNQVDLTYVGPSPAINGYIRSDRGLKIIAGATSGGVLFVVRDDSGINGIEDFGGKKFASPQYGNTQDISIKSYLQDNGYRLAQFGGDVFVIPAKTSDIKALFLKKELDGAWVPEPWGSILIKDSNGRAFLDERDLWENGEFATTVLVANADFLEKRPDLVKKVLRAHVDSIEWINTHPREAEVLAQRELESYYNKPFPADIIHASFGRMEFTYEPMKESVMQFADEGYELGLLGLEKPELSGIYYTEPLNEVLQGKALSEER